MTASQRFIGNNLDDAERVAWLREHARHEHTRSGYGSTEWTLPDGSRVERTAIAPARVAAWGTLPRLATLIEKSIKADRQTARYFLRCEGRTRMHYRRTGAGHWAAAAEQWAWSRLGIEADIRRHLRELMRFRRGQRTYTDYPDAMFRGCA